MTAQFALQAFRLMAADDLQGGIATYGGKDYVCSCGAFTQELDLGTGGYSPSLIATIEVAREDFDANTVFQTDQELTVTPNSGTEHACKIKAVHDMGPIIQLEVRDENQGA